MSERSYDYPAKNAVRESWMNFLPSTFPNPKETFGLYLPGEENLEFPGYAGKGMLPGALIAAEREDERFETVKRNGCGVRLVHGNVGDAVRMAEKSRLPRLAFANLDFEGSYHTFLEEMLSVFRIFPREADGGYLAVTSFAGRDDETLAQGVANISKFSSGLDPSSFWSGFDKLMAKHRAFKQMIDPRTPDHTHVSRTLGLLWWISVAMSITEYPPDGYGRLHKGFLKRIDKPLDAITDRAKKLKRGTDIYVVSEPSLADALRDRSAMLWPTEFRQIIYYNKHAHPMQTRFFRIWVDRTGERTASEVLEQVWKLAVAAPIQYYDKTGSLIEIKGKEETRHGKH